jgi:hypothetical protein
MVIALEASAPQPVSVAFPQPRRSVAQVRFGQETRQQAAKTWAIFQDPLKIAALSIYRGPPRDGAEFGLKPPFQQMNQDNLQPASHLVTIASA